MKALCFAAVLCCLAPVARAAEETGSQAHPLLEFARERARDGVNPGFVDYFADQVSVAAHALTRARPPDDADCASNMAAGKFAELHMDLATARERSGDLQGALVSYRSALACRPRSARILKSLAEAMFGARDHEGAREAVKQAMAITPRDVSLHRLAGNLDFIAERWTGAIARFRYAAAGEEDPREAALDQLMFVLAQLRAGVREPELVARRLWEHWPRDLLLYLQGQRSEADLLRSFRQREAEHSDEELATALFHVGQSYWARGSADTARDYFTAVVNMRRFWSNEYRLALAEIAKLNAR